MTELVFRDEPYAQDCEATVLAVNDLGGVVLDRTVFYPTGGGQVGDSGWLELDDGNRIEIATAVKGETVDEVVHVPSEDQIVPQVGARVTARLDWQRRHRLMRMHTGLHLLSVVLPYPVTGGQISDGKGRLDFNPGEASLPDKEEISARLNEIISSAGDVTIDWISDEDLAAKPDLVKTMSVKPPVGHGKVRLIKISDVDLQPCGGTHVKNISEIGELRVAKMQSKGKQNKRVQLVFAGDLE